MITFIQENETFYGPDEYRAYSYVDIKVPMLSVGMDLAVQKTT